MSEPRFLTQIPYASQPGEAVDEIHGTASRNELFFMSFSLLADTDLAITLQLTPLMGPDGERLAGDLHVVHRWIQSGLGVYQSGATEVSELLLKDDHVVFRDGYARRCDKPWHVHRSRRRYVPPDVRLDGDVRASLVAGKPKQFWVSIDVDRACRPGEYRGYVNVISKGRADVHAAVSVDVHPVTLEDPAQDLMLWYRGTLNCHHPHHYVPRKIFEEQVKDIHRHGFRSISFFEDDAKRMQAAIDIAHEAGFTGNVVVDAYREKVWSEVDFRGLTPVVYVADEPDAGGSGDMQRAASLSGSLKAKNVKTMASVIHRRSIDSIDSDIVSVFIPSNPGHGVASSGRRIYYYWHAHMEKPIVHRLLAGAFLWKSGAAGISPYCYQHLPGFPFSPFDDFDSWDPREKAPIGSRFRDHLATYPARRGVIPTLQWCGMADGITDLRYLTTREAALKSAEDSDDLRRVEKARHIRRKSIEPADLIKPDTLDILSDSNALPADDLSPHAFGAMRASLMSDILELGQATPGHASAAPGPRGD